MMGYAPRWPVVALAVLVLATAACGPARSDQVGTSDDRTPVGRLKVLVLGQTTEPTDLAEFAIQATPGNTTVINIAHQGLSVTTESEAQIPALAGDVAQVAARPRRNNPAGTTEATWKLRPTVKWRDATPLT